MKRTVWKYALPLSLLPEARLAIDMPVGARPLTVQVQHGQPMLWALCDPNPSRWKLRTFLIVATGEDRTDLAEAEYVASYQVLGGQLVYHVFVLPEDRQ